MSADRTKVEAVRALARSQGAVWPRDPAEDGLPVHDLHRLWQSGELELVERGLYR